MGQVSEDVVVGVGSGVRWREPKSGREVWVDHSLGWETVRTNEPRPAEHGELVARYLAFELGLDGDLVVAGMRGSEPGNGPNYERVAAGLRGAGVAVRCRSTYSADGVQVGGVEVGDWAYRVIA
jgi:hypothetical protein